MTSNTISKKLSITQSGETFTVTLEKADVHFDGETSLNIYVPADPRGFKRSWPIDIIPSLKIWLGVSDIVGDDVLQQIFIRDDLELLDEDLEKKGIRTVDGIRRNPNHSSIVSVVSTTTALPETRPGGSSIQRTASNVSSGTYTQGASFEVSSDVRSDFQSSTNSVARETAIHELQDPKYGDKDGYEEILDGVITAAQRAHIPDLHTIQPQRILNFDPEKLRQAVGPALINNWRNVHRDRKVGAAGELYV